MPDATLQPVLNATDDGFGEAAQKAVNDLNQMTSAQNDVKDAASKTANVRKQIARLEAQERKDAFEQLPLEEQRTKLLERQADLRKKLTELEAKPGPANETARLNLQLADHVNRRQLAGVEKRQKAKDEGEKESDVKGFLKDAASAVLPLNGKEIANQIKEVVSKAYEFAEQVADTARRLHVGTGTAQETMYAGEKTGLSTGQIGGGYQAIEQAQARAQEGDQNSIAAFQAFGLMARDVQQLQPDQIFQRMAENIRSGAAAEVSLQQATEVLGNGAAEVLTAMRNGYADAVDEIRNAGGIVDEASIQQLNEASEQLKLFGLLIESKIVPAVAELTKKLSEWLPTFAKATDDWGTAKLARYYGAKSGGASNTEALAAMEGKGAWGELTDKYDAANTARIKAANEKRSKIKEARDQADQLRKQADAEKDPASKRRLNKLADENADQATRLETGRDPRAERAARIEQLKQKADQAEERNKFEAMTPAQKIEQLQKKRQASLEEGDRLGTDESHANARVKVAELDRQINALQRQLTPPQQQQQQPPQAQQQTTTDALARIGGFRGGAGDQHVQIALRTLELHQQVAALTGAALAQQDVSLGFQSQIARNTSPLTCSE